MKKLSLILLSVLFVLVFVPVSEATLVPLEVDSMIYSSIGEWDSSHEGLEWTICYMIGNPNTDIYQSAKLVVIPIGINNGVYGVEIPNGWVFDLEENACVLSTGNYSDLIFPGDSKLFGFHIDSNHYLLAEGGTLEGTSLFYGDFPSGEKVTVSILPEPATWVILGLGSIGFLGRGSIQ